VGRPRDVVREAAAFFIEQVLLHPGADSYRVLGARPDAPNGELRRNMALLLKWLHPDSDRQGQRSVFATRVTRAWNDLKTPERRAAYDRSQRISMAEKSFLRKKSTARGQSNRQGSNPRRDYAGPVDGQVVNRRSLHLYSHERRGLLRRILLLLFGRGAL
jgi:DnaJ-class molecular chaperone